MQLPIEAKHTVRTSTAESLPIDDGHPTVCADRCYWGVLDTSQWDVTGFRARRSLPTVDRERLMHQFDAQVPIDVESLQVCFQMGSSQGHYVIACGLPHDLLRAFLDDHPEAITYSPEALPVCIESRVDPDLADHFKQSCHIHLNFLVGDYEPQQLRRQRSRCVLFMLIAICMGAALLNAAFEVQRTAATRSLEATRSARSQIFHHVLGADESSGQPGHRSADARFLGELRKLRQTRSPIIELGMRNQDASSTPQFNAEDVVLRLLTDWPQHLHCRTESITITDQSITISVVVDDTVSAEAFVIGIKDFDLDHWSMRNPAFHRIESSTPRPHSSSRRNEPLINTPVATPTSPIRMVIRFDQSTATNPGGSTS